MALEKVTLERRLFNYDREEMVLIGSGGGSCGEVNILG
jgi:hypothetical protein